MHILVVRMVSVVLAAIFLLPLTACGTSTPSLGLAPGKPLVQKAIALQVSQTQQHLTQQLQSSLLKFEITNVTLKQLEPLFIEGLPTYHVRGTYNLKMKLPQHQATQQQNPFDVYLQRQQEGKTWRLAIPQVTSNNTNPTWQTYLIR